MSNSAVPRPLEYGAPISLERAKAVMAAAEAEARANDWPMVIAQEKARCAVNFKRPTKAIEEAVAQGGLNLRMLATPGMVPLEGGVPLISGGKIVGAIGVSGMRSNQDGQVAEAGAQAL